MPGLDSSKPRPSVLISKYVLIFAFTLLIDVYTHCYPICTAKSFIIEPDLLVHFLLEGPLQNEKNLLTRQRRRGTKDTGFPFLFVLSLVVRVCPHQQWDGKLLLDIRRGQVVCVPHVLQP